MHFLKDIVFITGLQRMNDIYRKETILGRRGPEQREEMTQQCCVGEAEERPVLIF